MRVKTNWSEVSLKDYITISEISAIDMDEIEKHIKIISILSGESEETIESLNLSTIKDCILATNFINHIPVRKQPIKNLIIGGKCYRINTNIRSLKGSEYIDLTGYTKEPSEVTENLPKILSIFIQRVNWFGFKKGNHTLDDRRALAKLLPEALTMDVVFAMSGFFLKNWEALSKATLDYSILKMSKMEKNLRKKIIKAGFTNTGDGLQRSTA